MDAKNALTSSRATSGIPQAADIVTKILTIKKQVLSPWVRA
jgi:hypothetical protein